MIRRYQGTDFTNESRVIRYLLDNYVVSKEEVERALERPENRQQVVDAIKIGSYTYWPGDKIAGRMGWTPVEEEITGTEEDGSQ